MERSGFAWKGRILFRNFKIVAVKLFCQNGLRIHFGESFVRKFDNLVPSSFFGLGFTRVLGAYTILCTVSSPAAGALVVKVKVN